MERWYNMERKILQKNKKTIILEWRGSASQLDFFGVMATNEAAYRGKIFRWKLWKKLVGD